MEKNFNHSWPEDYEEHVWGPWLWAIGFPVPRKYRKCVHPNCKAYEYNGEESKDART